MFRSQNLSGISPLRSEYPICFGITSSCWIVLHFSSRHSALELEENALFHPSLINTMPKPMQDLIPGHSMTSNAFLKYLHNLQAWKQQQQYFLANIEIDMKPIEIDEEQLAKMKCRQIEEITEIIDETTHIAQIRDVCLQRLGKYMEFLKTNPLRKYIPKSRLFNGRSYQEYEEEFMLYYNIVVAHKAQNWMDFCSCSSLDYYISNHCLNTHINNKNNVYFLHFPHLFQFIIMTRFFQFFIYTRLMIILIMVYNILMVFMFP